MKIKAQSEPIPLHYNIYFGIDLIGTWYKVFFIPLFGFLVLFINSFVSSMIYNKEKVLSYYLVFITVFAQAILTLAAMFISFQSL